MTTDLDIWRSAQALVQGYGDQAEHEAAQRADAFLEKGDIDGQRVWLRILAAVEEMQKVAPAEGDAVH